AFLPFGAGGTTVGAAGSGARTGAGLRFCIADIDIDYYNGVDIAVGGTSKIICKIQPPAHVTPYHWETLPPALRRYPPDARNVLIYIFVINHLRADLGLNNGSDVDLFPIHDPPFVNRLPAEHRRQRGYPRGLSVVLRLFLPARVVDESG